MRERAAGRGGGRGVGVGGWVGWVFARGGCGGPGGRPRVCVAWLLVVLVASLVFRAPSGRAAVCAGGLLAVRAASFARRVVSKPGLAAVCAGGRCPTRVCCSWCRCCCGRRRARPPARSPHALLSLGVVDLEACPGPPDPTAPSIPVGLVSLIGGLVPCFEAWPGPAAVSEISHVIPLGLFQDLNCDRWNCNVFGLC